MVRNDISIIAFSICIQVLYFPMPMQLMYNNYKVHVTLVALCGFLFPRIWLLPIAVTVSLVTVETTVRLKRQKLQQVRICYSNYNIILYYTSGKIS